MKLYDDIIHRWLTLLQDKEKTVYSNLSDYNWPATDSHEMILKSEMAYELGEGTYYGIGSTVITTNDDFVNQDEVIVYGKDITDLDKPTNYARLSIVKVDAEDLAEGNELYNFVKKIDFVRYHLNPKGFMMRFSYANNKESARVAKQAKKDGIRFVHVGKQMIDQFHLNSRIKAVKVIFITLDDLDYLVLEKGARAAENITKTIDHILKNIQMDCHVCSLQKVCEEVEGMKQLHFGLQNQSIDALEKN